jgi:hypothetical protein
MQLHFSLEELKLLVDLLERLERDIQDRVNENPGQASALRLKQNACSRLLDRIVVRDFAFAYDELEDLLQLVSACRSTLEENPADAASFDAKIETHNDQVLQRLLDKLTEACAMA